MKKILITGVGGFIGRNLAKSLLDRGEYVYGVDIFLDPVSYLCSYENFVPIQVNHNDFEAIEEKQVHSIDIVYHLGWAGQLGGSDLQDFELQFSNVNMTKRLIDKLLIIGIKKFVFCGSISHYKYLEDINNVNADIYGLSKMYASKLALSIFARKGISCNIALLANTYGVGDGSKKAVNTMINKFLAGEKLVLIEGNVLNDWVYIDDTVEGLICIGEKGYSYKEYYVGHKIIPTFEDNLRAMKKALCSNMELQFGGYHDTTIADYSQVNLDELFDDTGFECQCEICNSIIKTAKWLRENNKEMKL